jgi:hypothetical protein
VEEKEPEERFIDPTVSSRYYVSSEMEDAPVREKFGGPDSGDGGKSHRRHRNSRRRGGKSGPGQPPVEIESIQRPKSPKPQKQLSKPQPKAEATSDSGETKRRRPYRRNYRRWNKGGEGGAPKGE